MGGLIPLKLLFGDGIGYVVFGASAHRRQMNHTQCRLQSEFHLGPIEQVFDIGRLRLGIGEKIVIEIRQLFRQGLGVAEHVCELLGHLGKVALIVIAPQRPVALAPIGEQEMQRLAPHELIDLPAYVGGRPIDGPVKLFHRAAGQLNRAVARITLPQVPDVVEVKRKAVQVSEPRRIPSSPWAQLC